MRSAVDWTIDLAKQPKGPGTAISIRLMNAYCVALASDDPRYLGLVSESGVNFPDGAPVAALMRHVGHPEATQVRGPSFFMSTIDRGREVGLRHYFFGTTTKTLESMTQHLVNTFPGMSIAGMDEAVFGDVDDIVTEDVVDRMRQCQPDIIWVGLGTPKQDYVAAELARLLETPCAGVGAAFDFVAGTQPEAPDFMRRAGMEWLFRLVTEPRRLWKRYLWGNSRFLSIAAHDVVASRRGLR